MSIMKPWEGATRVYIVNEDRSSPTPTPSIEYSAGAGISITDHVISNTKPGIQYGAGSGISIVDNIINSTGTYEAADGLYISGNRIGIRSPLEAQEMHYTYQYNKDNMDVLQSVSLSEDYVVTGTKYVDLNDEYEYGRCSITYLTEYNEDAMPQAGYRFNGHILDNPGTESNLWISNNGITNMMSTERGDEYTRTDITDKEISIENNNVGIHFYVDRMVWISAWDARPQTLMYEDLFRQFSV